MPTTCSHCAFFSPLVRSRVDLLVGPRPLRVNGRLVTSPAPLGFHALHVTGRHILESKEDDFRLRSKKEKSPLLPLYRRKQALLGLMFFLALLNTSIVRDTKDILLIGCPSGPQLIPFLSTYVSLPFTTLFMQLYWKLSWALNNEQLFFATTVPFVAFFLSFAFAILPNINAIKIPHNIFYATYFLLADLWGTVTISLIFWRLCSQISAVSESQSVYPIYGLVGQIALIVSGLAIRAATNSIQPTSSVSSNFGIALRRLICLFTGSSFVFATLHSLLLRKFNSPDALPPSSSSVPLNSLKKTTTKKQKIGFKETLSVLSKSIYIRNLAFMMVCYGISLNLVEVLWKNQLRDYFSGSSDGLAKFYGTFSTLSGIGTMSLMMLNRYIVRMWGFKTSALIAPLVLSSTGLVYFGALLLRSGFWGILPRLNIPLKTIVLIGAAQNLLTKSSRYALLDQCKELAYLPLSPETRNLGKSVIDLVGIPLGESMSSFFQQLLIASLGSLDRAAPLLALALGAVNYVWINCTMTLSKLYTQKTSNPSGDKEIYTTA